MLLYGLADRAEDDSLLRQGSTKRGLHTGRVHHRIHCHVTLQHLTLVQGNTQLIERLLNLLIHLIAVGRFGTRGSIVRDSLKINFGYL